MGNKKCFTGNFSFALAKRKEMGCKVEENIPSLVGFQPKVLLIGIGRPTAPKFNFEFGRGVGKGRRNPGTKTVSCEGVVRA